jgi:diketogulonate reductase-like aldo/keto reductase
MASFPKYYTLNNGIQCPIIGEGTHFVKNVIASVVYQSIKDGVRFIDTASIYDDEEEVGEGIKKALDEKIVKREELYVVTKLWTDERDDIEGALRRSLKKLKLDYVDLYLDHWPIFYLKEKNNIKTHNVPMHIMWEEMEKLVVKGLTKSIGVSNYNVQSLHNLLSFCKIKPVFNQVEFHPYLYQKELLNYCNSENIKIIAYNPICRGAYVNMEKEKLNLLEEPIVKELAEKYKKTPGQIVLNWLINLGIVPIPRTGKPERMKENLDSTTFVMEKDDYEKVSNLNKNHRFNWYPGEYDPVDIFY